MGFDVAEERRRKEEEAARQQADADRQKQQQANKEKFRKGVAAFKEGYSGGHICSQCGHVGKPKLITKGNLLTELFIWIVGLALALFSFGITLILAIVYSFWRHLSRFKGCPQCQGQMIKTDSPVGKKMLAEYHQ
ncbi:MAG: hypothetical protein KQH59_18395 [Desulfobulbaceae bacterium]|nr:hypothetical protein [Desulfobulbaceae bacterium]